MNDAIPHGSQPDEQATRAYSHDYPSDTKLTYSRSGNDAELRLSFTSEDPDMGTEEMQYNGHAGESLEVLAHDLRQEISAFLDQKEAHTRIDPHAIHDADDYYADFSRTALYAFEGALKALEGEKALPLTWQPLPSEKADWLYSDSDKDTVRGCIGHLRGDFGKSGTEFWTSWFDHQPKLKQDAFRGELQTVVDTLRQPDGLLNGFSAMQKHCREGAQLRGSYGFHAESSQYEYCLRCSPIRGDYHFYLYCYDKTSQRELARMKPSVADQLKAQPFRLNEAKPHQTKETER